MSSISNEIKSIFIKNIKGYDEIGKRYYFNNNGQGLLPNKLNIVVASNGFGKSSLAVALKATKAGRRIHLNKQEYFKEDETLDVEVNITCKLDNEEKELITNKSKNDINKIFDIFIINSHLDTKGIRRPFRGASSDLIVKDIELIQVPNKVNNLSYNISVLNNRYLTEKKFNKLTKKEINAYINEIIKKNQIQDYLQLLQNYSKARNYKKLLENPNKCEDLEKYEINYFIAILEIYKLDKEKFEHYVNYQLYKIKKLFAEELLEDIKTFNNFELNIRVKDNKLLVKLPKATLISNGQRDVVVFLANLLKLEFNFLNSNKEYGILVIDEVFDYLDDSNLLIAQYFLVNLIRRIGKSDKKLFAILLTHLVPNTFNHFYFNKRKFKKVFYLEDVPIINEDIANFIRKREEIKKSSIDDYNAMSKFLHYGIENIELPNINSFIVSFNNKNAFIQILKTEYIKYYNQTKYCPFSVAIFLRIFVEEKVYKNLSDDLKNEYLQKNTTIDKLNFAKNNNLLIDEKYFLLSAIYNEMAHNYKETLYFKLNNELIRNLIILVIGEQ